jgi:hypothetical protein
MDLTKSGIPSKVEAALKRVLSPGEQVSSLVKTIWKPSATTPIVWLAVTGRRCILFSTLRGGQLFKEAPFDLINSVTLSGDWITVLMTEPSDDWRLQVDPKNRDEFVALIETLNSNRRRFS